MDYYTKYLKYKNKYLELKKLKNQLSELPRPTEDIENTPYLKTKSKPLNTLPGRTFGKSLENIQVPATSLKKNKMEFTEPSTATATAAVSVAEAAPSIELEEDTKLDTYITTYFKTYNLITWTPDKLYTVPGTTSVELKEFCNSLNTHSTGDSTTSAINKCTPPYSQSELQQLTVPGISGQPRNSQELSEESCCSITSLRGTRVVPKASSRIFRPGSRIIAGKIDFEFINLYPKINTRNIRDEAKIGRTNYLRTLILENFGRLSEEKKEQIYKIFIENDEQPDLLPDNKFSNESFIRIINSEDFYGLDDVLGVVFDNEKYKENNEYVNLQRIIDGADVTHTIQQYENKLFLDKRGPRKTYYFYFSYGTLNLIEYVDWAQSLRLYVETIRDILQDPTVDSIIIAGHSVGSITIQHLAIELIKNHVDVRKIYVVGSGCRYTEVLDLEELELFKSQYANRYFFVLTGFENDGIIQYDHRSADRRNMVNKINTHFLICSDPEVIDKKLNCVVSKLEILDHDEVNSSGNFIPNSNVTLHDFKTYSDIYLSN